MGWTEHMSAPQTVVGSKSGGGGGEGTREWGRRHWDCCPKPATVQRRRAGTPGGWRCVPRHCSGEGIAASPPPQPAGTEGRRGGGVALSPEDLPGGPRRLEVVVGDAAVLRRHRPPDPVQLRQAPLPVRPPGGREPGAEAEGEGGTEAMGTAGPWLAAPACCVIPAPLAGLVPRALGARWDQNRWARGGWVATKKMLENN